MSFEGKNVVWDQDIIERYDLSGPRYTSYPTAPQFRDDFSHDDWLQAVEASNASGKGLSLYFHIPFCETLCYYCACNKVVTHNKKRAMPYLQRVDREMAMMAEVFDTSREVSQVHWGGGTPTYISEEEMTWLMAQTRKHFSLSDSEHSEVSVEVHPGLISLSKLRHMRQLGFNRLSMGIQDFDENVQKAVNRFNSFEQVQELVRAARDSEYQSISMDLIYGLPHQSRASVAASLDKVIELGPERLSLFNYAHMPHLFKSQSLINEQHLPQAEEKLEILHESIDSLQRAGYVYIGMDHFAKPDDSLVRAQRSGTLQRNFQGYSTHGDCDLIAFGVSAISNYGNCFIQNEKTISAYQKRIDQGDSALIKGFKRNAEDDLRQYVIGQLACHFRLDFQDLRNRFGVFPEQHFKNELAALTTMETDGLVEVSADAISVSNSGRLLIRRICMVFDQYIAKHPQIRYSRII